MFGKGRRQTPDSLLWFKLAVLMLAAPAIPLLAEAVFSEVVVVEGVKFYPDLDDRTVYYYAPVGIKLKDAGGSPAFSFSRYRYTGTRTTGDAGVFRGKALLTFTVQLQTEPKNLGSAQTALERSLGHSVRLYSLPIVDVKSDLIYAALTESGANESGTLRGGYWGRPTDEEIGEIWTERTYYVSADPYSADMLWQAYHKGNVLLSLTVAVDSRGIKEKPIGGTNSAETVTRTVLADAIRIGVSPESHPQCFREMDIDEKMPAGYTFLDVYCYDFQAEDRPEDLLVVDVEVRAKAVGGDLIIGRVRFLPDQPDVYKHQVHFRFAVSLDAGYSYRVIRTYGASGKTAGEWIDVPYWNGMCDVTMGQRSGHSFRDARPLDPRLLY